MDLASLERILVNYGVPLVILMAAGWALWIAFWRAAKYLSPLIKNWFADEKDEREKRIKAMETLGNTQRDCMLTLRDTNKTVHDIHSMQRDPESLVSNHHTLAKLNQLLENDVKAARAAIVALEAIGRHHEDLQPRLQPAIDTLRELATEKRD